MSVQSSKAHEKIANKATFAWLALAAAIILFDWLTKQWASASLSHFEPRPVFSWLNLVLAHNYGAAFSFLSDAGGWQRWFFTVLASLVTVVLVVWLLRLRRGDWRMGLALGLLIGGAIGNLVDRITLGYVVDFIDVHVAGYHWPAFNVADSAITCGIVLLLLDTFFASRNQKSTPEAGD